MSVCLLGATGSGKSTLGNILVDDKTMSRFTVGEEMSSCTTTSTRILNIVDTPGFNDTRASKVIEAQIYDNILKELLKSNIRCILFIIEKPSRLKDTDQKNMEIFLKFPNNVTKGVVITKVALSLSKTKILEDWKKILADRDFVELESVQTFLVDCGLYFDEDYADLAGMEKHRASHQANIENFTNLRELLKNSSEVDCKRELLQMAKSNPFKLAIQKEIEVKLHDFVTSTHRKLMSEADALRGSNLKEDEYRSELEIMGGNTFKSVKEYYINNIDPSYHSFLPLESIPSYNEFKSDVKNGLNQKNISYVKARQMQILKEKTFKIIDKISSKSFLIYETSQNPFLTIEEINKIWERELRNFANNTDFSEAETYEMYNSTKKFVEEDLKGFRSLIFGNSYKTAIKSKVLAWSMDTQHLINDGYKDLHNVIIVKCPNCKYPWGNQGACPSRTCLFCLHNFQWNKAKTVSRKDWDHYDYEAAYVPQVGETNPKYKTANTKIGTLK